MLLSKQIKKADRERKFLLPVFGRTLRFGSIKQSYWSWMVHVASLLYLEFSSLKNYSPFFFHNLIGFDKKKMDSLLDHADLVNISSFHDYIYIYIYRLIA